MGEYKSPPRNFGQILVGVMPMPDPKSGWGWDTKQPNNGCVVGALIITASAYMAAFVAAIAGIGAGLYWLI